MDGPRMQQFLSGGPAPAPMSKSSTRSPPQMNSTLPAVLQLGSQQAYESRCGLLKDLGHTALNACVDNILEELVETAKRGGFHISFQDTNPEWLCVLEQYLSMLPLRVKRMPNAGRLYVHSHRALTAYLCHSRRSCRGLQRDSPGAHAQVPSGVRQTRRQRRYHRGYAGGPGDR